MTETERKLMERIDRLERILSVIMLSDRMYFSRLTQIQDGSNIQLGVTTGTKIGTVGGASGQKIGFFNATPVVQQTGVAVTAIGIHAALVSLGLITA